jgi:hypothetical protein
MWFLRLSALLSDIKTPPRPTTLAARCTCLHFRHRPRPCGSLRLSAFLKRYCYVVAWWSSGRTRTPTKSSRLFFSPLDHLQVPLVDVGKHHLIMMASMKIIRVVAPSGGPGGLYTAVASSSTEYGLLFAEYQDVAQHKEESGKHQLIVMASMKIIRTVALLAASSKQSPLPQRSMDSSLLSM